ncbi:MAG: hypothetical protein HYS22_06660 [Deltaproteobacteria bacterium]|nr:hypothetical protein [Deltaproteobacteria bacterium]
MDKKRWGLTAVIVAVVVTMLEAIFHGLFLKETYATTASIWRPMTDMNRLMPLGWFSTLITSFIVVYIFHRGYEGKRSPLAEGLRFGLTIGLLTAIPMSVWTYIMWPVSLFLAVAWFVIAMIDMLVAGMIIGVMYKRSSMEG